MNYKLTAFLGCLALLFALSASGQSPESEFENANRLYDQGKYQEAAASYQKLLQSGNSSASVYFNLGNAYFKSGQLGRAIATYRALETRTPRDPELKANLRFALEQVQGPTLKSSAYQRALRWLTLNEWTLLAASGFWITLLLLTWQQFQFSRKRILAVSIAGAALATGAALCCLGFSAQSLKAPHAIVVSPEATARRGPLDEAESAFIVHDGAEFRVLDRNNGWVQVTVGEGRSGWLKAEQLLLRH